METNEIILAVVAFVLGVVAVWSVVKNKHSQSSCKSSNANIVSSELKHKRFDTVYYKWRVNAMETNGNRYDSAAIPCNGECFSIGTRSEDVDFILISQYVNPRHAYVCCNKKGSYLMDCGSTNGTYYSGSKVQKVILEHGAVIWAADAPLIFTDNLIPVSDEDLEMMLNEDIRKHGNPFDCVSKNVD